MPVMKSKIVSGTKKRGFRYIQRGKVLYHSKINAQISFSNKIQIVVNILEIISRLCLKKIKVNFKKSGC